MKRLAIYWRLARFALALALTGCASMPAAEVREIQWQTLNLIDTGQTVTIARQPDQWREANPVTRTLVGDHPTEKSVYVTMAAYALAHAAISYWLDDMDPGHGGWHVASLLWGYGTLTEKGITVHSNFKYGITPWEGSTK